MDTLQSTGTSSPLTEEQWAGLARLGDLGNKLGSFIEGPLAGPGTAALNRVGEIDSHYDLSALGEKLVKVAYSLDKAGLLDRIADNAEFLSDSLEVMTPILDQWMSRIRDLSVDELKADAEFVLSFLRKARIIAGFIEEKMAGELTEKTVALTEFMQRNKTDEAIAETLVQLGRIYRSGLLAKLGDVADYVAGLDEGTDIESLLGSLVNSIPSNAVGFASNLLHSSEDALKDASKDEKHLGGYTGIFHLLRDKEVQKGLRMLSVLPLYLEKRMEGDKQSKS